MKSAYAVAAGSGAAMVAAHYLCERLTGRELHNLERYFVGVLFGILLPFLVWTAVARRTMEPFKALCVISAGAGAGTTAAYAADRVAGRRAADLG